MSQAEKIKSVFKISDPRQQQIAKQLDHLVGPQAAAMFHDTCYLMSEAHPLRATSHLVAHLLREIESSLRSVLISLSPRTPEKTNNSRDGHADEIRAILKDLEISESEPTAILWLKFSGRENEYSLHRLAHRNSLMPPRQVDDFFKVLWEDFQALLSNIIPRIEANYNRALLILDALVLRELPSEKDIALLRNGVPNNHVNMGYFFGKLASHAWIAPLRQSGFFAYPPPIEETEDGKGFRIPFWPQSQFLVRMAPLSAAQAEVVATVIAIPPTDNFRVHEDFLEIAIQLPPELAARIAQREAEWISKQTSHLFSYRWEPIANLANKLVSAGQIQVGLRLLGAALEPQGNDGSTLNREPAGKFGYWEYRKIVEQSLPVLASGAGLAGLGALCELLDTVIKVERGADRSGPYDRSMWWRQSVEGDARRNRDGTQNILVTAIRDLSQQIVSGDLSALAAVVEMLTSAGWRHEGKTQPYHIFRRIALYLLRKFPNHPVELSSRQLLDEHLAQSISCQNEYSLFLRGKFQSLPPDIQQAFLNMVERGPTSFTDDQGRERAATPEDKQQFTQFFRSKLLQPVLDHLPADWADKHPEWLKELTVPNDFRPYWSGDAHFVGPTSPKGADEIKKLSIEELIQFLEDWKSDEQPTSPSPEGLGRVLKTVVESDPVQLAVAAPLFKKLQPTYARSLLYGLEQAIKQGRSFDWLPVLELCGWIVAQTEDHASDQKFDPHHDIHWGSAKKTVASLLGEGMNQGVCQIPIKHRDAVWNAIEILTHYPDPPLDEESNREYKADDAINDSINCVRGEAMHSAIAYGLWVRRNLPTDWNGFKTIPEVERILDAHLLADHSLVIRAILGWRFPQIHYLDANWAIANKNGIFPMESDARPYFDVAWQAYVCMNDLHGKVFDVLTEQYAFAVNLIGYFKESRESWDLETHLAHHLMLAYAWGKTGLDNADSLVVKFFGKASDKLLASAIHYMGQLLEDQSEIPPDVLERFARLWEYRLQASPQTVGSNHSEELAGFGWWFVPPRFEQAWAMKKLLETLRKGGAIEPQHLVIKKLAEISISDPAGAFEAFELIVRKDERGMAVFSDRDSGRIVVQNALKDRTSPTAKSAVAFINWLCSQGCLLFRDLL